MSEEIYTHKQMAALIILTAILFFIFGYRSSTQSMRTQAVRLNHAEWVVATNGTTTFKWK